MNLVKKLLVLTFFILSFNAFSENYDYAILKPGVQKDLENLISNPNNFYRENDRNSSNIIAYLKFNQEISNIFKKYGVTRNNPADNTNITTQRELISVGEDFDTYYQCVQFVRALSNAGGTGEWEWDGRLINESSYLKWRLIAKFKSNGKYWQAGDPLPYGHVAIAIGSNSNGVYVIDQNWEGDGRKYYGKVGIHIIPWTEAKKYSLLTKGKI